MSKVRPYQISPDGAILGQLMGFVSPGEWGPVDPPVSSGGGSTGWSGPFFDDFERPDSPLNGNNGWVDSPAPVADFYIDSGVVKQLAWGYNPILHERYSTVEGVADVTVEVGFDINGEVGGYSEGICICSTSVHSEGLILIFDGGSTYFDIMRTIEGEQWSSSDPSTSIVDHGWVGWLVSETMVIRCVYTEADSEVLVYQNDVLALTVDVSAAAYGLTDELPALTLMPYAGFVSNADDNWHTFNDFSIEQATEAPTPDGVLLDDLLDVDTTTVPPAPNQYLKYDAGLELWVPADLPSSTTGAPFEITDTPPDPPPYAGYAYMSLDFKVRIWTGTEWRQMSTVHYTPPAEGDEAIMLDSLVGRYRALDLTYSDGDSVDTWLDTSGLDNHLTTHTAGVFEEDGIGGLPSVMFARGTWYSMPAPVARPVTVVGVMRSDDTGGTGGILFGNDAADSYPYFGLIGANWRISDGGSTYVDYAEATPLAPHIMYARASLGGMMSGADGGRATTVGTMTFKPQNLGYWWINNGYSMLGPVSEMLVYNEALTDEQLDAIIHQLGLVYGITTSV